MSVERAKALMILGEVLGEGEYGVMKGLLVDRMVAQDGGSLEQFAECLKELAEMGFLSPDELLEVTTRVLSGPPPAAVPAISESTAVSGEVLARVVGGATPEFLADVARLLAEYRVVSVGDLFALQTRDAALSLFEPASVNRALFDAVCRSFRQAVPLTVAAAASGQTAQDSALGKTTSGGTWKRMYHLWNDCVQVLFVPPVDQGPVHVFAVADPSSAASAATSTTATSSSEDTAQADTAVAGGGEVVFLYIDISASMNHDASGVYVAPKSPDHPASSIKKVRDALPPLVLSCVKRGTSVTVVTWNYRVTEPIVFTPEMFVDKESGDLLPDDVISSRVKEATDDNVFRAKGGTNLESAIRDLGHRSAQACTAGVTGITAWLLTDGEETVFLNDQGAEERIPSNPRDASYDFFNKKGEPGLGGLTKYQQKLVDTTGELLRKGINSSCSLSFHVCFTGDAEPHFLNALRKSCGGTFHVLANLSAMAQEMLSGAMAECRATVTLVLEDGSQHSFSAASADGGLCSRGVLQGHDMTNAPRPGSIRVRVSKPLNIDKALTSIQSTPMDPQLHDGMCSVLGLENSLGNLLHSVSTAEKIDAQALQKAATELRLLRQRQMDAVTMLSRHLRAGSLAQLYMEKVLESVQMQLNNLARILEQFHIVEGQKYDAATVQSNELFTAKHKQAIAAGVEGMRVRLGNGFVSQTMLDRQVQKLVAMHGPRARKMLNRVCLLAETNDQASGTTTLTLAVVDGDQLSKARTALVRTMAERHGAAALDILANAATQVNYAEQLRHSLEDSAVTCAASATLTLGGVELQLSGTFALREAYPVIVDSYTRKVKTASMQEACKKLTDPLSYSSFLDLIREHNTLPAALYVISENQSAGLMFYSKELLYVLSGGSDMTSFQFFRLHWRLAHDKDNLVQVPGCFYKANAAMPIAPEPLTGMVLSTTMTGLMSEVVTGTCLAPLQHTGNLYIGYLMMHFAQLKHTSLDVQRMGEILSSLGVWIHNPYTQPKLEEVEDLCRSFVEKQSIAVGDSAGKFMPTKMVAYTWFDEKSPLASRMSALQAEMLRRSMKLLLQNGSESKSSNVSPKLFVQQIPLRLFLRKLIDDFSPSKELVDGIPVSTLETAEQMAKLVNNPSDKEAVLAFLSSHRRARILIATVADLVLARTRAGFPRHGQWKYLQRVLYIWFSLSTYSSSKLMSLFADFESTEEFERHVSELLHHAHDDGTSSPFDDVLTSWVDPLDHDSHVALVVVNGGQGVKLRTTSKDTGKQTEKDVAVDLPEILMRVWDVLFSAALSQWTWKGSRGSIFGIHELDYDVVRALRDSTLVESLSQVQLSIYHNAMEGRQTASAYASFAPPKPEIKRIAKGENFVANQTAKQQGSKPRLAVMSIGSVNSGKSSLMGRLIVELGHFSQHSLQRYEMQAHELGKVDPCAKYIWIVSKLKRERELGMTIELSMWAVDTQRYEMDLIDGPGHRTFAKSMAAGASMADVALLLVSAAPGEFETGVARGGLTSEEALIAYTQGVRNFVVAVNKMDVVGFSQERFKEVSSNVLVLLGKRGISENRVTMVPISSLTGSNVLVPDKESMPWFDGWTRPGLEPGQVVRGITLVDALDSCEVPARAAGLPLRIPVLKSCKVGRVGTVVIGRVACGKVTSGTKLVLMPGAVETSVQSIELVHVGRREACAGELVGICLKNVAVRNVTRGMVLCNPLEAKPAPQLVNFTARVVLLNKPCLMRVGYQACIHAHTGSFPAMVAKLVSKVDKKTGAVLEEAPTSLKPGEAGIVQFTPRTDCSNPAVLEPFRACPPLGRFLCRELGVVSMVGLVLSVNDSPDPDSSAPPPIAALASAKRSKFFSRKK